MTAHLTTCSILCVALLAPVTETDAPTDPSIRRAVERLGHDDYAVREQASRFLEKAGRAAGPALEQALESADAEVVARARRIVRDFRFGIYPDTPPDVLRLIRQFRIGDDADRLAALDGLVEQGEIGTVLKLLRTIHDRQARKQLTEQFLENGEQRIRELLIAGDLEGAEGVLRISAIGPRGMRNCAAFLSLQGRLEAAIARLRDTLGPDADPLDWQLLATMHRANGDLEAARAAAEKAGDDSLVDAILFELGDWPALAKRHPGPETTSTSRGRLEDLAFAAAYQRLAGRAEAMEPLIGAIRQHATAHPEDAWHCGEALLISGRFDEAIEILQGTVGQGAAVDILIAQHRYDDALARAGVAGPEGPFSPWFELAGPTEQKQNTNTRFMLGLRIAKMLHPLGKVDEAARLLDELAEAARDNRTLAMRWVCAAELELDMREKALGHAAAALGAKTSDSAVLYVLFPKHSTEARLWWAYLRKKHADMPVEDVLRRLQMLLKPAESTDDIAFDWREYVEEAAKACRKMSVSQQRRWLSALSRTCLVQADHAAALGYFKEAVEAEGDDVSTSALLRVADLLAEQADWPQAVSWYRRAWDGEPESAVACYLLGHALVQSGKADEGRRIIDMAQLLPLADGRARYNLASEWTKRGLSQDIAGQWQFILRTGEPGSWAVNEAAKYYGNTLSGKDNLAASRYWQWSLLSCLKTSTAIPRVSGYLQLIHLVHKARARGLLADGRIDEAVAELRQSHAALPGNIELALDLVPELERLQRPDEAEELFALVYRVGRQVCDDFPDSALAHNNLAWLAARCGRRLDDALAHAQRAVALAPDKAAYLDTLAEVHFQKGDRDRAVELAEQCLRLAPDDPHIQAQLARFRGQ